MRARSCVRRFTASSAVLTTVRRMLRVIVPSSAMFRMTGLAIANAKERIAFSISWRKRRCHCAKRLHARRHGGAGGIVLHCVFVGWAARGAWSRVSRYCVMLVYLLIVVRVSFYA